jgi:hypothetical protein
VETIGGGASRETDVGLSPGTVPSPGSAGLQLAPGPVGAHGQLAARPVEAPSSHPRLAPLSPGRYALQLTIGQGTHDKLRYAQALLGHALPTGDLAQVLDRALDALIARLEQRKFAATTRPRAGQRRSSANPRHVPAEVRRAVWARDGGRCTFVSESGRRCEARTRLEFDHADPVARGGVATCESIRLRCRAHNQHAAECAYGPAFMRHQRDEARRAREEARRSRAEARQAARATAEAEARAAAEAQAAARARAAAEARVAAQARAAAKARAAAAAAEVIPVLRQLGFRAEEARSAAALCKSTPETPLEQRVRVALSYFAKPRHAPSARTAVAT